MLLDVAQLFRIHVCEMRKVKAQPLRRVQRAGLLYVRPENVPQRSVHQMCSRVVANNPRAPFRIGHDRHAIAHPQRLLGHNFVRHQSGDGIKRAFHFCEQL